MYLSTIYVRKANEMSEVKRVLHVFAALDQGGVENFVMNVYRNIDTSKIQFDFALTSGRKSFFDEEVIQKGGRIFYFEQKNNQHKLKNCYINMNQILKTAGPFVAVHSHCYFFSGFVLMCAWQHRVKVRIAHSHESYKGQRYTMIRKIYEKVMRLMIKTFATWRFGCSKVACMHLYGDGCFSQRNVHIIRNGIEIEKYRFQQIVRKDVRKNLNIEDKVVVGHVGRFAEQKNHTFLIEIFRVFLSKHKNAVLLMIGSGPLENQIKEIVKRYGIENACYFLGVRDDVYKLLMAMDAFVFPSLYEGLGIALVEAQASGVPCIVSANKIPSEVKILDNFAFMSLKSTYQEWCDAIEGLDNSYQRELALEKVKEAGYDITVVAKELEAYYLGESNI